MRWIAVRRQRVRKSEVHQVPALHAAVDEHGIVVLFGELDGGVEFVLEAALGARDAARPMVLDLAGVTFIDAAGLSSLLHIANRERLAGRRITLADISPQVERILDVTGASHVFAGSHLDDEESGSGIVGCGD